MKTVNSSKGELKGLEISNEKQSITQLNKLLLFLKNKSATASMISAETGIPQKSICRYKRYLEKKGLLFEIEKKICSETGFRAWYLSINPSDIRQSAQLKLF